MAPRRLTKQFGATAQLSYIWPLNQTSERDVTRDAPDFFPTQGPR